MEWSSTFSPTKKSSRSLSCTRVFKWNLMTAPSLLNSRRGGQETTRDYFSLVLQDPSESVFWAGFKGLNTSWKGIWSTRVFWHWLKDMLSHSGKGQRGWDKEIVSKFQIPKTCLFGKLFAIHSQVGKFSINNFRELMPKKYSTSGKLYLIHVFSILCAGLFNILHEQIMSILELLL